MTGAVFESVFKFQMSHYSEVELSKADYRTTEFRADLLTVTITPTFPVIQVIIGLRRLAAISCHKWAAQ